MPLAWSIFLFWPTGRGKTKCFIWAVGLMTGSMAFCISGGKQYWQQRAAFWAGLCICRQHCAVNGINVRKIIRCLLLPQFAVRHLITIALLINILKYVKVNQFIVRRLCDALLFILHLRIFRILRCYIWGIRAIRQGSGLRLSIHHAALRRRICPHRNG